jgi:hypothetical protein
VKDHHLVDLQSSYVVRSSPRQETTRHRVSKFHMYGEYTDCPFMVSGRREAYMFEATSRSTAMSHGMQT